MAQSQRLKSAPQFPTSAEAGLPGYEFVTWFGVVAPKGTPPAVIAVPPVASTATTRSQLFAPV
ncbi:MAG: tripartite tricarboxylate transporter substrate-binding protein [Chthoniobacterales bacterium]